MSVEDDEINIRDDTFEDQEYEKIYSKAASFSCNFFRAVESNDELELHQESHAENPKVK